VSALPVVTLREAATVMLVRDDPDLHVFMLRRNLQSEWVGGAYVFPGGAVDPGDRDHAVLARCPDRSDADASAQLGLSAGGLGYWVAAVRETFEEAGVLLARAAATGELVDPAEPRLTELRDGLNAGAITFQELIESEDLVLDVAGIHAFSHWITPEGALRRYDTRFFLAAAPDGHAYLHDETETVASHWLRPTDALAASDAGDLDLIFPTRKSLEVLRRFTYATDLLAAVAAATDVAPPDRPRVVSDHGGIRLLLPFDATYGDSAGSGAA
jgi:8-oxo-dGTP pyrophosphatase MutT (NUDIX family)